MRVKKQFVSILKSIALTNETLANVVVSINQRLDSHERTIQGTINSLEKVSALSQKNSDLLLETLDTLIALQADTSIQHSEVGDEFDS